MSQVNPYNVLVERIRQGAYPLGARLPSERALADEFGVHRTTIQRLITRLVAEGFVHRQPGCRPVVGGGTDTSARLGVVAVLIDAGFPVVDNAYGALLLGAQAVLRSEGYRVLFLSPSIHGAEARYETELEELRSLQSDPVDGVILVTENPEGAAPLLRGLMEQGTAVVLADRWVDGVTADFVGVDNAGGAAMAAEHLLGLGHTRIAFADTPRNRYMPAEERKQGFLATLQSHGIPEGPENVLYMRLAGEAPVDARLLGDWLRANGMPTGFVCVHDGVAWHLARALAELGLRIPGDISIVGFDDDAERRNLGEVELTTIRQPFFEVGEDAAGLLVKRLRQPDGPIRSVRLSPSLVTRTSTAAPAGQHAEAPAEGNTEARIITPSRIRSQYVV